MTTENTTTSTLTVILDAVGRTILGQPVEAAEGKLAIKNPVILHVVPADNQGKMSVQLLPLFFREFLADKTGDVVVTYDTNRVSPTDIDALDFRLQAQYNQMFNKENAFVSPQAEQPSAGGGEQVINLFDEA
jgi:hypothetical protein